MYNDFAYFYDLFAYDIDYKKFHAYYNKLFKKYNVSPKLVLDICCGTGSLTTLLATQYDVIGIDSSAEMLNIAREKNSEILYLNQSMTAFELYGTVDAVVSSLDSVNYILNKQELEKHFQLVKNYLNIGGLYIFDISTCYKFKKILSDYSFVDEKDDVMFVWQNTYESKARMNTMYLDVFYKDSYQYNRISETHIERAYTPREIIKAAEKSGLTVLSVNDDLKMTKYQRTSTRIFFILRNE